MAISPTQNNSASGLIPHTYSFIDLPNEVLMNIFARLSSLELAASSCVFRQWNQELNNDGNYRQLFLRSFPEFDLNDVKKIKQEYLIKNNIYWNFESGLFFSYTLDDCRNSVGPMLFAGEELFTASVWDYQKLRIWDVKSKKCIERINPNSAHGSCIAVADEKIFLGGAASQHSIKIYNRKSKTWLTPLLGHTGGIKCLAIAELGENKKVLISGSEDHTIKIWDVDSMKEICVLTGHTDEVRDFTIVNNQLFSGSGDNTIRVWNLDSLTYLATLQGHEAPINSLATDKKLLFSSSADRTLRAWDIDSLKCLNKVEYEGPVGSVVSADPFLICSTMFDHKIRILGGRSLKEYYSIFDRVNFFGTLVAKDGRIYSDAARSNMIKVWDYTASHRIVLQDIADQLKSEHKEDREAAELRFLRVPLWLKEKIGGASAEKIESYLKKFTT